MLRSSKQMSFETGVSHIITFCPSQPSIITLPEGVLYCENNIIIKPQLFISADLGCLILVLRPRILFKIDPFKHRIFCPPISVESCENLWGIFQFLNSLFLPLPCTFCPQRNAIRGVVKKILDNAAQ